MMTTYKIFIKGAWTDALSGKTFDDVNPCTGELFARVACGDGTFIVDNKRQKQNRTVYRQ
jgi:acyl-CoA reductase-like NAD-dependent aldehyde dehydrogenase